MREPAAIVPGVVLLPLEFPEVIEQAIASAPSSRREKVVVTAPTDAAAEQSMRRHSSSLPRMPWVTDSVVLIPLVTIVKYCAVVVIACARPKASMNQPLGALVAVAVGVLVGVLVGTVGVPVCVMVGVTVAVFVTVGVFVSCQPQGSQGSEVKVGTGVHVGVRVGVSVVVGVSVGVSVIVGVRVAVPV